MVITVSLATLPAIVVLYVSVSSVTCCLKPNDLTSLLVSLSVCNSTPSPGKEKVFSTDRVRFPFLRLCLLFFVLRMVLTFWSLVSRVQSIMVAGNSFSIECVGEIYSSLFCTFEGERARAS
ncbi:putative structural protein [Ranid herpesvirus 3]|uniref:Putative structural protein n=1 Tax=Ranid herpesvirus 3 TaxID=1987509 RepID=A0A1X9T5D4_9VIRU|nr:putative structural protein [Ranid herpesvirus 3]ARR28907.1 putative structural protein [Ranid herpesvirus 3]